MRSPFFVHFGIDISFSFISIHSVFACVFEEISILFFPYTFSILFYGIRNVFLVICVAFGPLMLAAVLFEYVEIPSTISYYIHTPGIRSFCCTIIALLLPFILSFSRCTAFFSVLILTLPSSFSFIVHIFRFIIVYHVSVGSHIFSFLCYFEHFFTYFLALPLICMWKMVRDAFYLFIPFWFPFFSYFRYFSFLAIQIEKHFFMILNDYTSVVLLFDCSNRRAILKCFFFSAALRLFGSHRHCTICTQWIEHIESNESIFPKQNTNHLGWVMVSFCADLLFIAFVCCDAMDTFFQWLYSVNFIHGKIIRTIQILLCMQFSFFSAIFFYFRWKRWLKKHSRMQSFQQTN